MLNTSQNTYKHQNCSHATQVVLVMFMCALFILNSGCSKEPVPTGATEPKFVESPRQKIPRYSFAVHPLHNPTRLFDVFQPLVKYLNQHITGARFVLEASRDYASYDRKLQNQTVDFALPNPYQTIESLKFHYKVFAKMGDDERFRGIILVRKDSDIRTPSDLIGHKVSYPAPTALAATMLPQYFFHQNGVELSQLENHYVGSQESSIINVFHGTTDAAATWPPPWESLSQERPELSQKLKVIWQTSSLPNNGLVVREEIPQQLVKQVQTILVNLHTHAEGQQILQAINLSRFEPADNSTYHPVERFIQDFSQSVRLPTESK